MFRKLLTGAMALAVASLTIAAPALAQGIANQAPNFRNASDLAIDGAGEATPVRATHFLRGNVDDTADTLSDIDATGFRSGASGSFIVDSGDTITVVQTGNISIPSGGDITANAGDVLIWRRDEAGTGVTLFKAGVAGTVGGIDSFSGADDAAKLTACFAASSYCVLTRNLSLDAEVNIPQGDTLDLSGFTISKDADVNIFTMGKEAKIINGFIDANGDVHGGNSTNVITISGGLANNQQRIVNVDINPCGGYCIEFSGDGSGASLHYIGGKVFRWHYFLPAIKLPDSESVSGGLRKFVGLTAAGGDLLDAAGGNVTYIESVDALSITLRDASRYVLTNNTRIPRIKDRRAITGITQANPAVVTSVDHGLKTGNEIIIYDVGGMTEINTTLDGSRDPYPDAVTVTRIDDDTFSIDGENSTGYTAYTSGGEFSNASTFMIRGEYHVIQSAWGTAGDGVSRTVTFGKGAQHNLVDLATGVTTIDDSGETTNRIGKWPDLLRLAPSDPYLRLSGINNDDCMIQINTGANERIRMCTDASGNGIIMNGNQNLQLGGDNENNTIVVDKDEVDINADLVADDLTSGSWTPTETQVFNADAGSPGTWYYQRQGDSVCFHGSPSVDPTATGRVDVTYTIPIASDFSAQSDVGGVGSSVASSNFATLWPDNADDEITLRIWNASHTDAQVYHLSGCYVIK